MSEMPERIWAWLYTGDFNRGEWLGRKSVTTDVEYIRADLAALSSAAVAEREPLGWVLPDAVEFLRKGQQESRPSSTPLHNMPNDEMGWNVALYLDPPPTSELEADNARLRSEVEYQKKVSADRWETTERQAYAFDDMRIRAEAAEARLAEAMKALEPFAEIAGEAWADGSGWTNAACQNDRICDWFGPSAFRTARRVREGGKVDG